MSYERICSLLRVTFIRRVSINRFLPLPYYLTVVCRMTIFFPGPPLPLLFFFLFQLKFLVHLGFSLLGWNKPYY